MCKSTVIQNINLQNVNVIGQGNTGGLIGRALRAQSIYNCIVSGSVTSTASNAGLLAGGIKYTTVSNCFSSGTVLGNQTTGSKSVGGLVGVMNDASSKIQNSYSTANVTNLRTNGGNEIGGLVGTNSISSGSIINCYSKGSVTGVVAPIGGLIGWNVGTVTNSYWDTITSGQTTSAGIGKSTAEMKQQATFSGWDFANTWAMNEGLTYPVLKGMQLATVQSVTLPTNKTYKTGETLSFTLNFTANITYTGAAATLPITIGSNTRNATYASKTANSVTYSYTIVEGDLDSDGIALGVVGLGTDTIVDAIANQAYVSFGTQTTTGILVDGVKPTAQNVTMASNYTDTTRAHVGNVVTLNITASEAINTPTVTIAGQVAAVNDAGDLDPNTWKATYTMLAGDTEGLIAFSIDFTDIAGNAGITATAITTGSNVTFDKTAPVITLTGATPVTVEKGAAYVDAGATATEGLTASIVTVNPVNVNTTGSYSITYNVTDLSGNPATQITRTVNVTDTIAPVITLAGATPVTVERGTAYVDAGATATEGLTASIVTVNPVNVK